MFSTDWILTLFAILIPAESHAVFMTNFLVEGWVYFYKLVLTFLQSIEKELLGEEEIGNVLMTLKDLAATPGRGRKDFMSPERVQPSNFLDRLVSVFRKKETSSALYWEEALNKAQEMKLQGIDPVQLMRLFEADLPKSKYN